MPVPLSTPSRPDAIVVGTTAASRCPADGCSAGAPGSRQRRSGPVRLPPPPDALPARPEVRENPFRANQGAGRQAAETPPVGLPEGESWKQRDKSLRRGQRGLPGGSSLSRLLRHWRLQRPTATHST